MMATDQRASDGGGANMMASKVNGSLLRSGAGTSSPQAEQNMFRATMASIDLSAADAGAGGGIPRRRAGAAAS
jgi:hypothetical protein